RLALNLLTLHRLLYSFLALRRLLYTLLALHWSWLRSWRYVTLSGLIDALHWLLPFRLLTRWSHLAALRIVTTVCSGWSGWQSTTRVFFCLNFLTSHICIASGTLCSTWAGIISTLCGTLLVSGRL